MEWKKEKEIHMCWNWVEMEDILEIISQTGHQTPKPLMVAVTSL